jgi:hypothetical protein
MKKIVLIVITILVTLTGCEKSESATDSDVFFKIGRGDELRFDDIKLYDSSTHIFYLKEEHLVFNDLLNDSFAFLDKGDTIYAGAFVPGYSSFIPAGPMIHSPGMYGNHALRIDVWIDKKPDLRNCPRIIDLLKEHNLLHSGLSGIVDFVEIIGTQLTFEYTITNHDFTDLLIIDINKTGPELYHYFTNGLYLRDQDHHEIFSSTIEHRTPVPWNSWKPEWLSLLRSGESMSFTINYQVATPISPGEYNLSFEFPGLAYQVTKEQLFQGNYRIWLGDITIRGKITIP